MSLEITPWTGSSAADTREKYRSLRLKKTAETLQFISKPQL